MNDAKGSTPDLVPEPKFRGHIFISHNTITCEYAKGSTPDLVLNRSSGVTYHITLIHIQYVHIKDFNKYSGRYMYVLKHLSHFINHHEIILWIQYGKGQCLSTHLDIHSIHFDISRIHNWPESKVLRHETRVY